MNFRGSEIRMPHLIHEQQTPACDQQGATVGLLSRGMRWLQARHLRSQHARRLHLCATVPLGEKRFVHLIECDGQQFLIGGGAGSVCLLATLSSSQNANVQAPDSVQPEGSR